MNKKINFTLVVIIILLIIIVGIFCLIFFTKFPVSDEFNITQDLKCNYNSLTKSYIKKDPNCVINFLCTNDKEAFKDECGCGCEALKETTNDSHVKNYCTPEQKSVEICYELYEPVCGWFGQNIKCIRYPCAETFSNSCFACMNENVESWTKGECPK